MTCSPRTLTSSDVRADLFRIPCHAVQFKRRRLHSPGYPQRPRRGTLTRTRSPTRRASPGPQPTRSPPHARPPPNLRRSSTTTGYPPPSRTPARLAPTLAPTPLRPRRVDPRHPPTSAAAPPPSPLHGLRLPQLCTRRPSPCRPSCRRRIRPRALAAPDPARPLRTLRRAQAGPRSQTEMSQTAPQPRRACRAEWATRARGRRRCRRSRPCSTRRPDPPRRTRLRTSGECSTPLTMQTSAPARSSGSSTELIAASLRLVLAPSSSPLPDLSPHGYLALLSLFTLASLICM